MDKLATHASGASKSSAGTAAAQKTGACRTTHDIGAANASNWCGFVESLCRAAVTSRGTSQPNPSEKRISAGTAGCLLDQGGLTEVSAPYEAAPVNT